MKAPSLDPTTSRDLRWRAKQAAQVVEAEAENARVAAQSPTITVDLRLRTMARLKLAGFVLAFGLGGIATFAVTE